MFKSVKELVQYVFFGFLATSHIRMHQSVVPALKVLNIDCSVAVTVESLENLINEGLAAIIHLTYGLSKEFIIVDVSRPIPIE